MSISYSLTHYVAAVSILPDLHLENTIQGSLKQSSTHLLFLPISEPSPLLFGNSTLIFLCEHQLSSTLIGLGEASTLILASPQQGVGT